MTIQLPILLKAVGLQDHFLTLSSKATAVICCREILTEVYHMSASLRTKKPEALKHAGVVLFRKTPAFLFIAALLAISGVGLPNLAGANPYFNSPSENCDVPSGPCPAHPTWVLADDFNDGN